MIEMINRWQLWRSLWICSWSLPYGGCKVNVCGTLTICKVHPITKSLTLIYLFYFLFEISFLTSFSSLQKKYTVSSDHSAPDLYFFCLVHPFPAPYPSKGRSSLLFSSLLGPLAGALKLLVVTSSELIHCQSTEGNEDPCYCLRSLLWHTW